MAIARRRRSRAAINRYAPGGAKGLSTAHRSGRPGGDSSERRETLSPQERLTLRYLADALVPSVPVESDPDGFYGRRASDLAIDDDVARVIERYVSPNQRADFRRLLRTLESPWANLLLSGRSHRFSSGTPAERERFLLGWAHSRLGIKRQGFHAVKRLVLFLTYAKALEGGVNPNWPSIGYAAPQPRAPQANSEPSNLSIECLRPESETSLEADVCVVGTGAGGSVIAAKLAGSGHRVIVLDAGPYRTADAFTQREAEAYDTMFQGHGVLTTRDLAFSVLAGQTAGGSSTINWMTCLRPPRWAREEWERECGLTGVASPAFDSFIDEVWSRLQTSSMNESKAGEATPVSPHSRSHSSRAHRGGLRHVIQLIVELPPAVCPARTLKAKSRVVRTPWPWNIVSYASASRWVNASAVRYGPASRTMTRWPEPASFAAITEPPAPVPTTHTSASRLVSLSGRRHSIERFDGSLLACGARG